MSARGFVLVEGVKPVDLEGFIVWDALYDCKEVSLRLRAFLQSFTGFLLGDLI